LLKDKIKTKHIGYDVRLQLKDCQQIATEDNFIQLEEKSYNKMQTSYDFLLDKINDRVPIYGINTQFGDQVNLLDKYLHGSADKYFQSIEERQQNLIQSHCCGLGSLIPKETVKLAIVLRAHCLGQGYSGVSPGLVNSMLEFANKNVIPVVRRYGSVGASGDLIPLASIATAFIGGDTDVYYQNKIFSAKEAIKKSGLKCITPKLRDGIAMINGTSMMSAIASRALYDLNRLFKQMLKTIALSLEAMQIIQSAYHPLVHQVKYHTGQIAVNKYILECLEGSDLLTDLDELREVKSRPLQDCYSSRSVAQGFGPFSENLETATNWIENEINSVNDNPIVDVKNQRIHHGANFMGYYVTDACDILKMNVAQASTWIHAILANLVHPRKNAGLPTSLVNHAEKFNGFRPLQLLAASIAVQNRKLAQSQQSFMLPTEGDNQDVNSLGTHAAFDFTEAVDNLASLNAILLVAAVQALEFRGLERASLSANRITNKIRKIFPVVSHCRPLTNELNKVVQFLKCTDI
jgi:histidine ammonia-lyase